MRTISFFDEDAIIWKIVTPVLKGLEYKPYGFTLLCLLPFLKHFGLWKEQSPRPPPKEKPRARYSGTCQQGAKIPIFSLEANQDADGVSGKAGKQVSVRKGTIFIRPPSRGKSNYLSILKESTYLFSSELFQVHVRKAASRFLKRNCKMRHVTLTVCLFYSSLLLSCNSEVCNFRPIEETTRGIASSSLCGTLMISKLPASLVMNVLDVFVDSVHVGKFPNSGYYKVHVPPGAHFLILNSGNQFYIDKIEFVPGIMQWASLSFPMPVNDSLFLSLATLADSARFVYARGSASGSEAGSAVDSISLKYNNGNLLIKSEIYDNLVLCFRKGIRYVDAESRGSPDFPMYNSGWSGPRNIPFSVPVPSMPR